MTGCIEIELPFETPAAAVELLEVCDHDSDVIPIDVTTTSPKMNTFVRHNGRKKLKKKTGPIRSMAFSGFGI